MTVHPCYRTTVTLCGDNDERKIVKGREGRRGEKGDHLRRCQILSRSYLPRSTLTFYLASFHLYFTPSNIFKRTISDQSIPLHKNTFASIHDYFTTLICMFLLLYWSTSMDESGTRVCRFRVCTRFFSS